MKILLIGRNGQVGWELRRSLSALGEVIAPERSELDLGDVASIRRAVRGIKPSLVVNAAAYTEVDKAESEAALAFRINADAPAVLAEETKRVGAGLVHYSTDYVFDGAKHDPYVEEDAPNPLNVYGRSKLAGEVAVRAIARDYLILRTSWVYAQRGRNFLLTMLRLAQDGAILRIVADQRGAPTYSRTIADATAHLITCLRNSASATDESSWRHSGLYHLSCMGSTSWCGFARSIFALSRAADSTWELMLEEISTSDYGAAAARPLNSGLSNDKLKKTFDISLPRWDHALELCMEDLQGRSGLSR